MAPVAPEPRPPLCNRVTSVAVSQWRAIMWLVIYVVVGVVNNVLFKKSVTAMTGYPFFFNTANTVLFGATLALVACVQACVSGHRPSLARWWQVVSIASLDVVTNVAQVWASSSLGGHAGFLGMLVQQMVLPATVILSAWLLHTRYTRYHVGGACLVVAGVIVSGIGSGDATGGSGGFESVWSTDSLFLVVYLVSVVPAAANKVWKEYLFQSQPQSRVPQHKNGASRGSPHAGDAGTALLRPDTPSTSGSYAGIRNYASDGYQPAHGRSVFSSGCCYGGGGRGCFSAVRRVLADKPAREVAPVALGACENSTELPLSLVIMPMYFPLVLHKPLSSVPAYIADGARCAAGLTAGLCEGAPANIGAFLVVGTFMLAATLMLIKHSSATMVFMANAMLLPLTDLAFSMRAVMGNDATPASVANWIGVVVIVAGLSSYGFAGVKREEERRRREAHQARSGGGVTTVAIVHE